MFACVTSHPKKYLTVFACREPGFRITCCGFFPCNFTTSAELSVFFLQPTLRNRVGKKPQFG